MYPGLKQHYWAIILSYYLIILEVGPIINFYYLRILKTAINSGMASLTNEVNGAEWTSVRLCR